MAGESGDTRSQPSGTSDAAFGRTVTEMVSDGVFEAAADGRLERVNDALVDLTGFERESLVGEQVSDLVAGDDASETGAVVRALVSGDEDENGVESRPVALSTAVGDRLPVDLRLRAVDGAASGGRDGESRRVVGVVSESAEGLGEREERFRSLVQEVDEYAIFMLDTDGHVETWNDGAEHVKGYEADEILGEHFSRFYTPADRTASVPERNLAKATERGRVEDEGWRVRQDGSRFWANVVITALHDDEGSLRGYAKVTRDMTERREREQQLRQERDLTDRVLESSPVGIAVMGPGGSPERANERMQNILGLYEKPAPEFTKDEMTVYDEDGDRLDPAAFPSTRVFETGEPVYDWTGQVEHPDGERRWVSANAVPLLDDDGDVERVVVTSKDVTDRVEHEQSLRQERDLVERIVESSPVGIGLLEPDGSIVRANERAEELLGMSAAELSEQTATERTVYDEQGDPIPADERPFARALRTGEPVLNRELQIDRPDGERRWVSVNCTPLFGDDGEVEQVLTVGEDVTERHEHEQQLRQERERFRSLVQEVDEYAIFMLDTDGHIETWNDGAERIKGYDREEILGEHFSQFYTPSDRDAGVPGENLELAAANGRVEDEGWRVRQDGSRFWANVVITALHDDEGSLRGYAKVTRDMTERREREQQLRQERDLVESIIETGPMSVIVVNDSGEVVKANGRAKRRLGVPEDDEHYEMGDRPLFDEDGEFVPPEERPYADVLTTGEPVEDRQCQLETATGERRWVSLNAAMMPGDEDRVVVTSEDVTDLKETQRALARERDELESELSELFGRVTDAFFALDEDWKFTYVNGTAKELLDRSEAELLGSSVWEAFPDAVDTQFEHEYRRAMENQEAVDFEEYDPTLEAWFSVSAYPSETGISVYFRDVTDRKQYEQTLAGLHGVTQDLPHAETKAEVAERVVDAANDLLGLPGVAVYLHDEAAGELHPAAYAEDVTEHYGDLPTVEATAESSILGSAFAGEETVQYEDVHEPELLANDEADVQRNLFIPLGDHGVLLVGDEEVGSFDDGTVELAELLTANAESAMDRVDRETELRERERELRQYHTVTQTASDAIVTVDDRGVIQSANPSVEDVFGYDPGELVGESMGTLMPADDRDAQLETLERLAAGGGTEEQAYVELVAEHRDGDEVQIGLSFSGYEHDGDRYFTGIARDVTERKRRERELERYETIVETVSDGIYVLDEDGRFTMVNDAQMEMLGYDRDELLGEDRSLVAPPDAARAGSDVEAELLAGERDGATVEVTVEDADGDEFPVETTLSLIEHDDGYERVGVVRDVTERVERERVLEESERRYRTLAEQFPNGAVGLYDDDLRYTLVAGPILDDLGLDAEEMEDRTVHEVFPEETTEQLEPVFRDGIEGGTATTEVEFAGRIVRVWTTPVRDEDGDVFAGLSFAQDVTERVERERALEESERRYRTLAQQFPNGLVAMVDTDLQFTVAGGEAFDRFEYDVEDVEGRTVEEVFEDDDLGKLLVEEYRAALDGESRSFEIEYDDRDWMMHAVPVQDGHGDVFAGLVMAQDVTERKERERALELYETIVETVNDGVYVLDEEFEFTEVNDAYVEMTGYDRDELLGAHSSLVVGDDVTAESAELMPELSAEEGSSATLEADILRADGTRLPAESNFTVLPSPGSETPWKVGVVRDVSERVERERELRDRMRQQETTAELGRLALEEPDLDRLFRKATERVAETLDNDYCKVLDLDEDAGELLLRQGVGWQDGYVGEATVAADENSQAGYTLQTDGTVVVEDVDAETRFSGPDLLLDHDVQSGMSTIIGPAEEPWGILGTHDTDEHEFSEHDVNFLESVSNVLATAVERSQRVAAIDHQRQHLAALDNLNAVVQDINVALAESSSREEIERVICERVVDAEEYAFAWIGEVDRNREQVVPSVWAGVGESYLDDLTIALDDSSTARGPTGRAVTEKEMQTTPSFEADDAMGPWQEAAGEFGFESSASIPLVYEGALYGVLNVYARRPAAFEGREGEVVAQLSEVVGHAIRAVERKEALMSESLVELEFRSRNVLESVLDATTDGGVARFERTVRTDEGSYLQYVSVEGLSESAFRDAVERSDVLSSSRLVTDRDDDLLFEVTLEDPPVTSLVASYGGRMRETVVMDGELEMQVEVPHSVDIRTLVAALEEVAPDVELVSQRSRQREDGSLQRTALESLTDKQLAAVEAAFFAGYFDWPRDSTAEDLAASMGVSAPTLHQHLRKGERKLLAGYFEQ